MMLKHNKYNVLKGLLILTLFLTSFAPMPQKTESDKPIRGAATEKDLSSALFYAIKTNDFGNLASYIPADDEIRYLQKTSSERNKPFFEELEEAGVKERLEQGFNVITRKGIEQNINWSQVELVDYETRSCSIELIGCNVTFTIVDQQDNRMVVTYDGIKVKERWFVFQNLGLVREDRIGQKAAKK